MPHLPARARRGSGTSAAGTASARPNCGGKNALTAEGSTAQQNAIAEFNKVWGQVCPGKTLSYNPTGSGAGVEQFIAEQVDFAGSDSALSDDQAKQATDRCGGNPAWNLPLVFGPVAMAYNVDGVSKLVVNGDVLAKIFTGPDHQVERPGDRRTEPWHHPARGRHQADLPVGLVGHHRQLPEVPGRRRPADLDQGRRQGIPGRRRRGCPEVVRRRAGRPGHPGRYRLRREEPCRRGRSADRSIDNGAGGVALTDDTAKAAIGTAKFAGDGNDLKLDLKSIYSTKAAGAYPLILATYEIVCSKGYDADTSAGVKSFLTVSANQGAGESVDRRLRPAAGCPQAASADVRQRDCVVGLRASAIAVRIRAG